MFIMADGRIYNSDYCFRHGINLDEKKRQAIKLVQTKDKDEQYMSCPVCFIRVPMKKTNQ